VAVDVAGTHAELRFAAGAAVRERVERFAAAESQCCAFLTMRIDGAPDEVRLTIDAPEDAETVLAELVDAFRGLAADSGRLLHRRRLGRNGC
jgi:hypothetical protein